MSLRISAVKLAVSTLGAVALMTVAAEPVSAQTSTSNLSVTATVAANCTIATTAVAFGAYDPVVANASAALDGTGTVTITCTQGAVTSVALNTGSNASGLTRRLASASARLQYELYKETTRTTVWGDGSVPLTGPTANDTGIAPSSAPRSFTVYGRIAAAQDVPAGNYTDTVLATVNF